MDQNFNQTNWIELKVRLKQNFPMLTNADLHWRNTSQEEHLSTIALKLGKTNRELKHIISTI